MKKQFFSSKFVLTAVAIFSVLFFTQCTDEVPLSDCDGYTGTLTNKQALALQARCHFMSKDTIAVWTARYQKNKPTASPTATTTFGDSCSFNNSIVRAIITNDSCIGLRVIYGMDEKNIVHNILVGIKPDYTTLYVRKPKDCGVSGDMQKKGGEPEDEVGGGEMGMNP
jgi:hypothetical protein